MPIHVADRLQNSVSTARRLGYLVRFEPLGGAGTSWCEISGRIHLFIDLHQSTSEQSEAVDEILRQSSARSLDGAKSNIAAKKRSPVGLTS